MSSLRNSIHRRNHKERSQLSHRARFGILEKHKDYVLRARDYHSKQDRLNLLKRKAADRNKDEFYFAMTRQKTDRGVHVQERGNQVLPVDIVKVLKTQDENYLRTMRTAGLKVLNALADPFAYGTDASQLSVLAELIKSNASGSDDQLSGEEMDVLREAGIIAAPSTRRQRKSRSGTANHVVFAEDEAEARQYADASRQASLPQDNNATDETQKDVVDLGWKIPEVTNKSKKPRSKSSSEDNALSGEADEEERQEAANQHRMRLLKELSARLVRDRQLRYAERELEMQRLLMGKGGARKLSGVERVGGDSDADEDDEVDIGRPQKKVDEKTWKPRVYKWRVERKK
ncbi:small-subunit processome [Sparassis latifolia]